MLKHWLLASRPKTLIASVLPVVSGSLLAYENSQKSSISVSMLCLLYCIFIQIGTNFSNDYFDFKKGADKNRVLGPKRMVSSGLLVPKQVLVASLLILALGFAIGLLIMVIVGGSKVLLLVGVTSFLCALGYTGGPFPLAYRGLGDLFVILFFGLVAVETTHYVLCLSVGLIWQPNWILSIGVGFVINNLLVVNNYRDYLGDLKVGKKTTVVIFGLKFGRFLFLIGVLVSTLLIPVLVPSAWSTIFLLPLGLFLWLKLHKALIYKDYSRILSLCAVMILFYTLFLLFGYLAE